MYTDNKKLINKYAHIIIFDCNEEELELLGKYTEMAKEIGAMVKKYNEDNIFSFMTDEESYERLYRSQIKTATEHGIEQGIEKNKIDTAYSLLKENVPLNIISRTTGYTQDYLKSIKL